MSTTVPTAVPAVETTDGPVTLDAVREHVAARALTPSGTGTVGLELERHVADVRAPGRRVPWDRLTSVLAGFSPPAGSRITLEPGGQVELSTPPGDLAGAVAGLERDAAAVADVLAADGLVLNSTGLDPLRPPQRVNPASRYRAMAGHFDAAGHHDDGATMMCSTASLQVNLDAGPATGWADRLAHVHRLTPVLVALAASSPVRRGTATGAVCGRQGVWGRLEPGRCRMPGGGADPVGDWTGFALAAPVMFVRSRRTGECEPVRAGVALADWAAGRVLLDDRAPTAADVDAHLSTLWPPVRLRGFLELRFLDAVPAPLRPGLAAVVATVVDDPVAADAAAEAAAPVAHRQAEAVRDGLGDDGLRRAALAVLTAAAARLTPALAASVHPWIDLVERGRGPADLVLERFHAGGPAACLIAEDAR
ncbi:glutamate-cysteine ligase family protein [Kineococcus rhizosphaerae]|uniref:Glutamate--cysteine ligase EgtA n=1 Tax=Kineococcus rhizosphaerae TaxID=559628 RepID=A0A2T0R7G7_9ACTN|nr:glutamate-cysteine ligase family protein [Kineococcus rhizosphaerae]PRY17081.1 glutamate--cysteine ligase [Kineococcus rhizosphaerae]